MVNTWASSFNFSKCCQHSVYSKTSFCRWTLPKNTALKNAAISNAQAASGLTKVKVLKDNPATIDEHSFGEVVYRTKVDGIDITYANFYSNFDDVGSIQLIFFAGSGQFDDLRSAIDQAVSRVTIEK